MPKLLKDFVSCTKTQVLLKIAYNGKNYCGVAFDKNNPKTVEQEIFNSLTIKCLIPADFDLPMIRFSRAGRTDACVNAAGNYISLAIFSNLDKLSNLATKLNSILPKDIFVVSWALVPDSFNARFHCRRRIYKYCFSNMGDDYDIEAMKQACNKLVGEHDFRNFCKVDLMNTTKFVRTIYRCEIEMTSVNNFYEIVFVGSAFLRQQVRNMVQILFLIGQGLEKESVIEYLLDIKQCPTKPIYCAAAPNFLRLHDCVFKNPEAIIYQTDDGCETNSLTRIIPSLLIEKLSDYFLLTDISSSISSIVKNESLAQNSEFQDKTSSSRKRYRPIKSLPKDVSVEDKISGLFIVNMVDKHLLKKVAVSFVTLLLMCISSVLSFTIQCVVYSLIFLPQETRTKICSIVFRRLTTFIVISLNPFMRATLIGPPLDKNLFKTPKIIMFNHNSNVDPLFVCHFLPGSARYLAKHVLFSFPIAGWAMSMAGDIPVVFKYKDKDAFVEKRDILKLSESCETYIRNGVSVVVFPEGGRSPNQELMEFKNGMFIIAQKTEAEIITGYIHNSQNCWKVGDALLSSADIYVSFGKVIESKGKSIEETKRLVRSEILSLKESMMNKF